MKQTAQFKRDEEAPLVVERTADKLKDQVPCAAFDSIIGKFCIFSYTTTTYRLQFWNLLQL
jgi:hypothetical protein